MTITNAAGTLREAPPSPNLKPQFIDDSNRQLEGEAFSFRLVSDKNVSSSSSMN